MSEKETKELRDERSGLKIRRVAAPDEVAKPKRNQMKLRRPTRSEAPRDAFGNSGLLEFPTDRKGLTSAVKSAMISAASRLNGDKEALELLKATVTVCLKHAEARCEQHVAKPKLKRRGAVAEPEFAVKEVQDTVDKVAYPEMLAALKEAGIVLDKKRRKKADVEKAFLEMLEANKAGE